MRRPPRLVQPAQLLLPTLAALQAEAKKEAAPIGRRFTAPPPRISLEGGFDAYLARIDKAASTIRRKMRRAAESQLPQEFRIVDDRAALNLDINHSLS